MTICNASDYSRNLRYDSALTYVEAWESIEWRLDYMNNLVTIEMERIYLPWELILNFATIMRGAI